MTKLPWLRCALGLVILVGSTLAEGQTGPDHFRWDPPVVLSGCNRFEGGEVGVLLEGSARAVSSRIDGASFGGELAVVNDAGNALLVSGSFFPEGMHPEEMLRGAVEVEDARVGGCEPLELRDVGELEVVP